MQGVGVLESGARRWKRPSPEFRFAVPAGAQRFEMQYAVPGVVLQQTGPLQLSYCIDGDLAHRETIRNEGDHQTAVPLPTSIQAGGVVNVRVQVHNPYVAAADQVRLSFQLKKVARTRVEHVFSVYGIPFASERQHKP